jgi:hypothetical protein
VVWKRHGPGGLRARSASCELGDRHAPLGAAADELHGGEGGDAFRVHDIGLDCHQSARAFASGLAGGIGGARPGAFHPRVPPRELLLDGGNDHGHSEGESAGDEKRGEACERGDAQRARARADAGVEERRERPEQQQREQDHGGLDAARVFLRKRDIDQAPDRLDEQEKKQATSGNEEGGQRE